MNGVEDIVVDILVPSSDKNSALELKLVLLSSLLLNDLFFLIL
jgi:hypothetical protein